MTSVFSILERLKEQVESRREFGDLDAALETADRAVEALDKAYAERSDFDDEPGGATAEFKSLLAEWHGIRGGILRRQHRYAEARQSYEQGAKSELGDTYNTVNAIVMGLMADPGTFTQLGDEIAAARGLLQSQLDGPRHDQWWAWADMGLLRLLDGQIDEAFEAYDEFKRAGPRRRNFESVIDVLEGLGKQLGHEQPTVAEQIEEVVEDLVSDMPSS